MSSRAIMTVDTKKTNPENYSEVKTKLLSRIFRLEKNKVLHSTHEL